MDDTVRDGEETMFDIIRTLSPDNGPEDDGSLYLNNSDEGIIFDEEEWIDEGNKNDNKGDILQITKIGEVYLYKASSDHYMY